MKVRIKFKKYGVMKFIGHLDIMRYFQKAMRRADIDIAYSEGFSPHQIMSFAAPLGVGIISQGEYLDIEVHSSKSSRESVDALNATMVEGVEVVSFKQLDDHAKTAMAIVAAADYNMYYKDGYEVPLTVDELHVKRKEFYELPTEILITKKTKKSEKIMDLKQLVYGFQVKEQDGKPYFYLKVCTGSTDNVKPELVLEAFYEFLGLTYEPMAFQIERIDVYAKDESSGQFISLDAMGEEITA
ncbi:MAG: TIGR03936 family radical SAM-associated protein [Lachnospiraceae bacterium]|nr:TIGR03936 family radical SAM-associated protein [Lachnospiraceae bacterium]